ncbi:MAG: hypothetical protein WCJ99_01660 [Betaproteobacteria bacterium]|jgi:hypothetical protein
MSNFYQLFLAWGILLVVVLSFYLIDKVNTMYRFSVPAEIPKTYSDGLFGELVGKNLWDAMSGLPVQGIDPKLVENLKPHYEPILRQHIEHTFMEGFRDGQAQRAGVPPNNRQIPTPRGSVESWLPLHHLASIYQAGSEFAIGNPEEHLRLQQSLDQVTAMLYARTNFELKDPYSETLLKLPIQEGLMPDPELVSQTVPEQLTLEQNSQAQEVTVNDMAQEGQQAKMQELSNSLSGFGSLGDTEPAPAAEASSSNEGEVQEAVLAESSNAVPVTNLNLPQAQPV